MQKKQKIIQHVKIEKIWYWGIGIWRHSDGRKILVQWGVLPGSVVDIVVTKSKKDFFEWRVFFVHELSKEYAERSAPCPHYLAPGLPNPEFPIYKQGCGGCKRQQVTYEKQLSLKMQVILDSFRGIQNIIGGAEVRDILWSPEEFGYRNKIEYSFGDFKQWDTHNQWALGFHKQWQFSQIIDIDECLLVTDTARNLFHHIKALCKTSWLPVYNQKRHIGVLRHLVIREWINTWQFLVNLSIADAYMDESTQGLRNIFQETIQQDEFLKKHVTTWIISINNWLGDAVYTNETIQRPLRWDGYIYEKLQFNKHEENNIDVTFKVSANSFFQTNTHGAEVLFSESAKLLGDMSGPILDLYCGAGSIGLSYRKLGIGESLYGIEIVPDAIKDAIQNAQINHIENTYFIAGKVEQMITSDEAFARACEDTECIIVDPPRDGLHKNIISFLVETKKQHSFKLMYISCNPVTLARDLELLSSAFKPRVIQPVDMFPHTHHIETICLLS